ncbi:hypothetical protein ASPWEDRAFT_170839 [Aspergillus wentii DTO 134E9]|uniref:Uncharacterized protein n=1 Tax=Aspergillus wentii DTO 134E9 TaxID=1073089 RepID=A0A1L9RQZ7_ASPWE|nr:uncharacterized protein ASPWEDRAFT_170839 [Aspergillus wentii DTO 134E9]KAI9928164.1 hypothetical protein MW887_002197 [Aspergillus wentii]OJJ37354.1 hypothetical protein ASPWEDRAFT_170839 [Aspergillus wentii DTO 134E9]
MPTSKTDTALRFPESDDQKRRLRNTTQDQKYGARLRDEASTGSQKSQDATTWTTEQLLGEHMDASGNPVPDPASFGDGAKARKGKEEDEPNLYDAMHDDFD